MTNVSPGTTNILVVAEIHADWVDFSSNAGIDAVQQYGFGQGDQSNESAFEQAKDEQISDEIRRQFKGATGEEIPIEDKETRFG